MAGSTFGRALRVTTAGESHGPGNIVIVDGCPPGIVIDAEAIQMELDRRRPGQSALVTQRKEPDHCEILSGVYDGRSTGTPIAILVRNKDAKSKDYSAIANKYRPGHADHSYDAKFGIRDPRGGGRASARETVSRVAAGAIAKKIIAEAFGGEVLGYVVQVGDIHAEVPEAVTREQVESRPDGSFNPVRCPDPEASLKMEKLIKKVRKEKDSIGGVAEIVGRGVPAGLGEPVFDKLKADLAKAIMSIPAVVGFEYGAGFAAASTRGSAHNDEFHIRDGRVITRTNRHGGILGGISTGMPLLLRAAVKPTSSLPKEQKTVTSDLEPTTIATKGRHDPCLLPRFVPMAEAMVALVIADHWLRQKHNT